MILDAPERRRALRAIVFAVAVFVLIALTWRIVEMLANNAPGLREIARYTLMIIGLGMLGYVSENGIRAFNLKGLGGTEVNLTTDDDEPAPAASVTATATVTATPAQE